MTKTNNINTGDDEVILNQKTRGDQIYMDCLHYGATNYDRGHWCADRKSKGCCHN